jgi:hypothetical protein
VTRAATHAEAKSYEDSAAKTDLALVHAMQKKIEQAKAELPAVLEVNAAFAPAKNALAELAPDHR